MEEKDLIRLSYPQFWGVPLHPLVKGFKKRLLSCLPSQGRKHFLVILRSIHSFHLRSINFRALHKKMKFSITDIFSKCDQIRSFLLVMENFIFFAVRFARFSYISTFDLVKKSVVSSKWVSYHRYPLDIFWYIFAPSNIYRFTLSFFSLE